MIGRLLILIWGAVAFWSGNGSLVFSQRTNDATGWCTLNGGTTGGSGGDTLKVSNYRELQAALTRSGRRIIFITDTIILEGKREVIRNGDVTVTGNQKAVLWNGGIRITGNNVILHNLVIGGTYQQGHWDGKGNAEGDAISIYGKNIWINHCDLRYSFDGLLDISKDADLITVSWTKFSKHNKVMLIGSNDEDTVGRDHLRTTIHHCWFDGFTSFYDTLDKKEYRLQQRMPRVRFGDVHVYNNYYEYVADYCVAARIESDVVVEGCYFRNLSDAHIIDDMGKGIEDPDLVAFNNIYDHVKREGTTHGTAFVPSEFYSYLPHNAGDIPALVMNGAGKTNSGTNHDPVAEDDTLQITGKDRVLIHPQKNDHDPDNKDLRIVSVINQPLGDVIVHPDGLQYRPPENFTRDVIEYQIIDYKGGVDTATIYLIAFH